MILAADIGLAAAETSGTEIVKAVEGPFGMIEKTMERQVWAYDLSDGGLSRRFSPVCKAAT